MNAATSLPRKVSPSPTPTTSGELRRAATTESGCCASSEHERERALQLPAHDADGVGEPEPVGDAAGRRGGRRSRCRSRSTNSTPAALEVGAQVGEVLDDAVVHDGDPAGRVGVRVGVAVVGRAVGGPAGVAHAGRAGDRAVGEFLVQVLDAAGLLGDLQRAVRADDGDARGVVAAVLEAAQALDDDLERRTGGRRSRRCRTRLLSLRAGRRSGRARADGGRRVARRRTVAAVCVACVVGVCVTVAGVPVTVTVGVRVTTCGVTVTVTGGDGAAGSRRAPTASSCASTAPTSPSTEVPGAGRGRAPGRSAGAPRRARPR